MPPTLDGWSVAIGGMVERPRVFSAQDLSQLPGLSTLRSAIKCGESMGTFGALFEGLPLTRLVLGAGVDSGARYVCIHSGPFTAAFALDSLERRQSVLAFRKDGALIRWDEGGPIRLVAAKGACFDMVKWVERVTFEADNLSATAQEIVRSRRHPKADA